VIHSEILALRKSGLTCKIGINLDFGNSFRYTSLGSGVRCLELTYTTSLAVSSRLGWSTRKVRTE